MAAVLIGSYKKGWKLTQVGRPAAFEVIWPESGLARTTEGNNELTRMTASVAVASVLVQDSSSGHAIVIVINCN